MARSTVAPWGTQMGSISSSPQLGPIGMGEVTRSVLAPLITMKAELMVLSHVPALPRIALMTAGRGVGEIRTPTYRGAALVFQTCPGAMIQS